jgi:hypothetical protein
MPSHRYKLYDLNVIQLLQMKRRRWEDQRTNTGGLQNKNYDLGTIIIHSVTMRVQCFYATRSGLLRYPDFLGLHPMPVYSQELAQSAAFATHQVSAEGWRW